MKHCNFRPPSTTHLKAQRVAPEIARANAIVGSRVPGGQWGNGAMGNAMWTGVRLTSELIHLIVRAISRMVNDLREVQRANVGRVYLEHALSILRCRLRLRVPSFDFFG